MIFYFLITNFLLIYILYINKNIIADKLKLITHHTDNTFHKKNAYLYGGILLFPSLILTGIYLHINKVENLYINFFFVFSFMILAIVDDIKNLRPIIKIFFCSLLSIITIFYDSTLTLTTLNFYYFDIFIFTDNLLIIYIFPIFCILLLVNAFNFTDGINCLAGLIGLSFLIYVCIKNYELIDSLYLLMTSILIFLYLNYSKSIFLGDSGNYLISSVTALIILKENFYNPGSYYAEEIFLLFLIPGIDMFRLFITRIIKKQNPFKRDNDHLHYLLLYQFGYNKSILLYLCLVNIPIYIFYFFNNILIFVIFFTLLIYAYLIHVSYLNKNKAT
jgi:UDP-GlcNAc:undecaprenyl-phosphate GlcNAc-1-phosphate transferase